ncbi:hypothetical protein BDV32DRAFT_155319 [Aspergillus pseudonomiae]|uniref:Uncharacterized protein n=1 Tax=Aspergillus pseudonomiae TaxID=1506151 RepID=A0A5N7CTZ3_9EURO|nr:uncharacterized protein BDV37DRAFT_289223 [Aspergillus pseudonomiae]KAB8254304.1 hypothetical protein BDV32DRAFT_155319 [Aspergillus pseudonomiae]KAE8397642.1 hypothetical protein BDV37DRAFT_289223 [Aspergillus pseudonomiae]
MVTYKRKLRSFPAAAEFGYPSSSMMRTKMKLSIVPVALLISSAAAGSIVTQQEANDWYQCTTHALNLVNSGKDDSSTTCTLLNCLSENAERYQRGGMYGKLSGILEIACFAKNIPIIGSFLK